MLKTAGIHCNVDSFVKMLEKQRPTKVPLTEEQLNCLAKNADRIVSKNIRLQGISVTLKSFVWYGYDSSPQITLRFVQSKRGIFLWYYKTIPCYVRGAISFLEEDEAEHLRFHISFC